MFHPGIPAAKMRGAEGAIADKDGVLLPCPGAQTGAYSLLQRAIALDPAITDDLAFEIVIVARTEKLDVAPIILDVGPFQLHLLIVRNEQHQWRIRVPFLKFLHQAARTPLHADFLPMTYRSEGRD